MAKHRHKLHAVHHTGGKVHVRKDHMARGGSVMHCAEGGQVKGGAPKPRADRMCRASGGWIAGATKNKGALHRSLDVPAGEKIPAKKLAKAAHSENPRLRKEANLAKTLAKLRP